MKILLINTPRSPHNGILEHASEQARPFIHKKLIGPPLGLLTVAEAVKDHDVVFIETKGEYDLNPDTPPLAAFVREIIEREQPDIVATTVIASEFYDGMEILRVAKQVNPEIVTVAGGLHATLCPQDFAGKPVDIVCPGESAHVFREVVQALEQGRPLQQIGGIYLNDGQEYRFTGPAERECLSATKDFLMPDRRLLARWRETYKVGKSPDPATYVFTSLGCPYRCTFCSIWPQYGGAYRQREVESVIEELKRCDDYPVVRFADANSMVGEEFLSKLFDRIDEEGIRKFFIMDLRVDAVAKHPKLVEKLAKGGLKVVICGFESFRNEELRHYNKSSQAEFIREAIEIFHQNGIMIRGNYVVPPDYTEDDFSALQEYASSHRVVYAGYTILTPMPGTPYYEEQKDRIIDNDLSKYNFFNSVMKTELEPEDFYRRVGDLWIIKKGTDVI